MVAHYWWEMKRHGSTGTRALRKTLCAQPVPPPAVCAPQRLGRQQIPAIIIGALLLLVAALLAVLYLTVPAAQTAFNNICDELARAWGWLGALGDGLGGLVVVIVILTVIGGGLWRRQPTGGDWA